MDEFREQAIANVMHKTGCTLGEASQMFDIIYGIVKDRMQGIVTDMLTKKIEQMRAEPKLSLVK